MGGGGSKKSKERLSHTDAGGTDAGNPVEGASASTLSVLALASDSEEPSFWELAEAADTTPPLDTSSSSSSSSYYSNNNNKKTRKKSRKKSRSRQKVAEMQKKNTGDNVGTLSRRLSRVAEGELADSAGSDTEVSGTFFWNRTLACEEHTHARAKSSLLGVVLANVPNMRAPPRYCKTVVPVYHYKVCVCVCVCVCVIVAQNITKQLNNFFSITNSL